MLIIRPDEMKKLYLFLLFCFILSGCDKETIEEPSKSEFIVKEEWQVASYQVFYYNEAGELIRKVDADSDWKYDFSDDSLRISSVKDNFSETSAYSFSESNGGNIVTLTKKSGSFSIFEIDSLSGSEMVWRQDSSQEGFDGIIRYYDPTIGKTAARVIAETTITKL